MLKRTISVGLLLIMALAMAAPMFHLDCDMPCCQEEKMTCCETKQELMPSKSCRMDMKSCDMGGVFVPIISGPFHQNKMKIDMHVQKIMQTAFFIYTFESNYNPVLLDYPPEPPPAYNLPLLA